MSLEEVSSISRVGDMVSVGLSVDGVVVCDCSRARRFLARTSAAGTRSGRAVLARSAMTDNAARDAPDVKKRKRCRVGAEE